LWLAARPAVRARRVAFSALDSRVETVSTGLFDQGRLLDAAVRDRADAVVVALMGAGHASPELLSSLSRAAARVPVVACTRCLRGGMLVATYGFRGSEADVRASGAIVAGMCSPPAARATLLGCLGAGLGRAEIAEVLAVDDVQ
jgi:L-asparaginase/Glu-tRNA(Gln) amidotransferase subunit D